MLTLEEIKRLAVDLYIKYSSDDDGERGDVETTHPNKERSVTILTPKDVFAEGRQKMIDMNIPFMCERKKLREQRTNVFFLEIHGTVTKGNENSIVELDKVHNEVLFDR